MQLVPKRRCCLAALGRHHSTLRYTWSDTAMSMTRQHQTRVSPLALFLALPLANSFLGAGELFATYQAVITIPKLQQEAIGAEFFTDNAIHGIQNGFSFTGHALWRRTCGTECRIPLFHIAFPHPRSFCFVLVWFGLLFFEGQC